MLNGPLIGTLYCSQFEWEVKEIKSLICKKKSIQQTYIQHNKFFKHLSSFIMYIRMTPFYFNYLNIPVQTRTYSILSSMPVVIHVPRL